MRYGQSIYSSCAVLTSELIFLSVESLKKELGWSTCLCGMGVIINDIRTYLFAHVATCGFHDHSRVVLVLTEIAGGCS